MLHRNVRGKVVVASYHLWDWPFKAGMHYLTEFFIARGWDVAFLTVPFSLLTIANVVRSRETGRVGSLLGNWCRNGVYERDGRLVHYAPLTLVHPSADLPVCRRFLSSERLVNGFLGTAVPSLAGWLTRRGFGAPDLLVVESGASMAVAEVIDSKMLVYRISDDPADTAKPANVVDLEGRLLKKAGVVLAVSRPILQSAVERRGREDGVYYLPNGVDIPAFEHQQPSPPEYRCIPRPRAVYVGGVSPEMLDYPLIFETARRLPPIQFVIIGPVVGGLPPLMPENVHFIGAVNHRALPGYLQHADVGLIPFRRSKMFAKLERPLKFYDYLASGLPVVATDCGHTRAMEPYATVVDSAGAFAEATARAVKIEDGDRADLQRAAATFSWANRYVDLDHILRCHGFDSSQSA